MRDINIPYARDTVWLNHSMLTRYGALLREVQTGREWLPPSRPFAAPLTGCESLLPWKGRGIPRWTDLQGARVERMVDVDMCLLRFQCWTFVARTHEDVTPHTVRANTPARCVFSMWRSMFSHLTLLCIPGEGGEGGTLRHRSPPVSHPLARCPGQRALPPGGALVRSLHPDLRHWFATCGLDSGSLVVLLVGTGGSDR